MIISIPKSISEIDKSILSIPSGVPIEVDVDNLLESATGIPLYASALTQWILSVYRRTAGDVTFFSSKTKNNEIISLEALAQSIPGLFLALLPSGQIRSIDKKQSIEFKNRYLQSQKKWPDLISQYSESLICIDALPKMLPPQLYVNPAERILIDSEYYGEVLKSMLTNIGGSKNDRLKGNNEAACGIVYELFRNTHDHARHDFSGADIKDSIRGIHSKFYPIDFFEKIESKDINCLTFDPLLNYIKLIIDDHKKELRPKKIIGFLEVSIFDSGAGLSSSFIGGDVSNLDSKTQYEHVIKCFSRGYSSVKSGVRGFGLWRVLNLLNQTNGFIRVRSNKVHVFREFRSLADLGVVKETLSEPITSQRLYDWEKGLYAPIGNYPNLEGTFISVLLPLGEV